MARQSRAPWVACMFLVPWLIGNAQGQSSLDEQLLDAAKKGEAPEVMELLKKGADPNAKSEYGVTPLYSAADRANLEVVKLLLDHGADPNAKDLWTGKTTLNVALSAWTSVKAPERRAQIVHLLVEKGGGAAGEPLVLLIQRGFHEEVKSIVARGGIEPIFLNQALAAAKTAKQAELVDLLAHAGAHEPGPADSFRAVERIKQLSGAYRGASGQEVTLLPDDDQLLLERAGTKVSLIAVDPLTFRSYDVKVVLRLPPGPVPPREIMLSQGAAGKSEVFTRVAK